MTQDWPGQLVSGSAPAAPRQRATPRRQAPQIRFADDRDALIRTVIGEAAAEPPEGQQAVAAVVMNRARARGKTAREVVLEPNQFEPWGNPETAARLMSVRPDSPEYRRAAALVDTVLRDGVDPTGGADHFYAPAAQAALGRSAPAWAKGTPTVIGGHHFFRLGGGQAPAQTAGDWPGAPVGAVTDAEPDLDLTALARGDLGPVEVEIDRGLLRENGRLYTLNQDDQRVDLGSEEEWAALSPEEQSRRFDLALAGRSPEFMAEYEAALGSAENIPAWLANLSQGQSLGLVGEAVAATNFLAPMTEGVDRGTAYEAARAAWRDRQAGLLREDPLGTVGMQLLGGLATPGLKGSGDWIGAASGSTRIARAGAVGGGYGAAAGVLNAEDADLGSRVQGGLTGGLTGAGVGAVGQRTMDGLLSSAAARRASPTPQRELARRGVDMTPGQMLGGAAQRVEDAIQSWPFIGDSIRTARNRNMATFDRAAINEALEPIGQTVSGAGRDAIRQADDAISAEYGRILDNLVVTPDAQYAADIQAALNPANLSRSARTRLQDTVADIQARTQGPISGRDFKQIESELTGLIQSATRGGPDGKPLIKPLREAREALRAQLRRQDPQAADDLAAANTAFANFDRVRRAASNPATARNDGLFSPGNVNSVLARAEGRNYGRGEGRLQDLTDAGVTVLGEKVPDSGTPLRSLLTMGAPAAGGLTMMGRSDVVTVAGIVTGLGSLGYGRQAQNLLNAAYRASDPGATRDALAELARVASRDPAALPYYEQLVSLLVPDGQREPRPAPGGLLSPTPDTRQGLLTPP